jgi:hypothetical protein
VILHGRGHFYILLHRLIQTRLLLTHLRQEPVGETHLSMVTHTIVVPDLIAKEIRNQFEKIGVGGGVKQKSHEISRDFLH